MGSDYVSCLRFSSYERCRIYLNLCLLNYILLVLLIVHNKLNFYFCTESCALLLLNSYIYKSHTFTFPAMVCKCSTLNTKTEREGAPPGYEIITKPVLRDSQLFLSCSGSKIGHRLLALSTF